MHSYLLEFGRFPNDGGNVKGLPDLTSARARKAFWVNVIPPRIGHLPYAQMIDNQALPIGGNSGAGIFACPSDTKDAGDRDGAGGTIPYDAAYGAKFYLNYIYSAKFTGKNNAGPRAGQLRDPSNTVLVFERRADSSDAELPPVSVVARQGSGGPGLRLAYDDAVRARYASQSLGVYRGQWQHVSGRHRNGSNVAFCDGSARWVPFAHFQLVLESDPVNHNTRVFIWGPLRAVAK